MHKHPALSLPNNHYEKLKKLDLLFPYCWQDINTIKESEVHLAMVKAGLKELEKELPSLDPATKNLAGQLYMRLGTFYLYAKLDPTCASANLTLALPLLSGIDQAWANNHLALCCYRLRQFSECQFYYNNNISHYSHADAKDPAALMILAYAVWVRSLMEYYEDQLVGALNSGRFALEMFKKVAKTHDHCLTIQLNYAMMAIENKSYFEAKAHFEEIDRYWQKKKPSDHLNYGKFYYYYAQFLEEHFPQYRNAILDKYQKAHHGLSSFDNVITNQLDEIEKKITLYRQQHSISNHAFSFHPNSPIPKSAEDTEGKHVQFRK